jgi:hypothetical protein
MLRAEIQRALWASAKTTAQTCSACKLAQDMVPTAHTKIEVRAQPLKNSAGRVPQAAD